MKQHYFLFLLFLPTTPVCAQQKSEAGFVVKAGSFTLPHEEKNENTEMLQTYLPGASFSFGVFALQRLGRHFDVSAEVLYNFSAYQSKHQYAYRRPDFIQFWSDTRMYFDVQSFMFPMKVHFRLKKDGKFSLAAGFAPNFMLTSHIQTTYKDDSGYSYSTRVKDRVVRKDGSEGVQLFTTLEAQYRINPYTSIGLDFTGSFNRDYTSPNPGIWFCGVGIEEYYYPFWMQSLAVSLQHNILR